MLAILTFCTALSIAVVMFFPLHFPDGKIEAECGSHMDRKSGDEKGIYSRPLPSTLSP